MTHIAQHFKMALLSCNLQGYLPLDVAMKYNRKRPNHGLIVDVLQELTRKFRAHIRATVLLALVAVPTAGASKQKKTKKTTTTASDSNPPPRCVQVPLPAARHLPAHLPLHLAALTIVRRPSLTTNDLRLLLATRCTLANRTLINALCPLPWRFTCRI